MVNERKWKRTQWLKISLADGKLGKKHIKWAKKILSSNYLFLLKVGFQNPQAKLSLVDQ